MSDRKYLPRLLELIQKAEHSIEVSMYQALLATDDPSHPVYQILETLGDTKKEIWAPLLALFVFSFHQTQNWLIGFNMVILLSFFSAVAAIILLANPAFR